MVGTLFIASTPPGKRGGLTDFQILDGRGGLKEFSFSGGDKCPKGGVDFSGGGWGIANGTITFLTLIIKKIEKKSNKNKFFLLSLLFFL